MTADLRYTEQTLDAVHRLWRAIGAIKRQRGQEHEFDHLVAAATAAGVDRPLMLTQCLAVLAEEVAQLQQEVQEQRWPEGITCWYCRR